MDLPLTGKTAIVTGASRGIALAITRALTREGVHVTGAARTITSDLRASAAHTVAADLSTAARSRAVAAHALTELGGIDILVNNVGAGDPGLLRLGDFLDADADQWRELGQQLQEVLVIEALRGSDMSAETVRVTPQPGAHRAGGDGVDADPSWPELFTESREPS